MKGPSFFARGDNQEINENILIYMPNIHVSTEEIYQKFIS